MLDEYTNVTFQSSLYTFDQLCEKNFLSRVLHHLRQSLGGLFNGYHFIIYSSEGSDDVDLTGVDPAKTVIIYISDETSSIPYALCSKVRAVFKSYLPRERIVPNLFSFPLGYVDSTPDLEPVPIDARSRDVFFCGNLNGNRAPLYKVLATPRISPMLWPPRVLTALNPSLNCDRFMPRSYLRFTREFRAGLSGEEYARSLVDSKIVLCPRGFRSAETFRYFEAARAGAIIITEQLPPLDIYSGGPAITVDTWRGLRKLVSQLLARPEDLVKRQKETLRWWKDVCSETATAARIAEQLS